MRITKEISANNITPVYTVPAGKRALVNFIITPENIDSAATAVNFWYKKEDTTRNDLGVIRKQDVVPNTTDKTSIKAEVEQFVYDDMKASTLTNVTATLTSTDTQSVQTSDLTPTIVLPIVNAEKLYLTSDNSKYVYIKTNRSQVSIDDGVTWISPTYGTRFILVSYNSNAGNTENTYKTTNGVSSVTHTIIAEFAGANMYLLNQNTMLPVSSYYISGIFFSSLGYDYGASLYNNTIVALDGDDTKQTEYQNVVNNTGNYTAAGTDTSHAYDLSTPWAYGSHADNGTNDTSGCVVGVYQLSTSYSILSQAASGTWYYRSNIYFGATTDSEGILTLSGTFSHVENARIFQISKSNTLYSGNIFVSLRADNKLNLCTVSGATSFYVDDIKISIPVGLTYNDVKGFYKNDDGYYYLVTATDRYVSNTTSWSSITEFTLDYDSVTVNMLLAAPVTTLPPDSVTVTKEQLTSEYNSLLFDIKDSKDNNYTWFEKDSPVKLGRYNNKLLPTSINITDVSYTGSVNANVKYTTERLGITYEATALATTMDVDINVSAFTFDVAEHDLITKTYHLDNRGDTFTLNDVYSNTVLEVSSDVMFVESHKSNHIEVTGRILEENDNIIIYAGDTINCTITGIEE